MQNIRHPQSAKRPLPLRRIMLATCAFALFCACMAAFAAPAQAKSYTMPSVDIQADVGADGSLHVTETRAFDFSGDYTAVWWILESLPSGAELEVSGVSMGSSSDALVPLSAVSFQNRWRDSGGPGNTSYSVDVAQNGIYVFSQWSDELVYVQIDYTIEGAVAAYQDIGELYWKYIGSSWAEDSENVTCTVTLPVPNGADVNVGDNVRAWGHGPLDGEVTFSESGDTVTLTCPKVSSGQYAETRIVFPVNWLTELSASAKNLYANQLRLPTVLADEQEWADEANFQRVASVAYIIGLIAAAALIVLWGVWMFLRHGREHKPTFTEDYWRDVPAKGVHPAAIARLWRFGKKSNDDFTATIMHLANTGAISINKGSYEQPGLLGAKKVEDYYLTYKGSVADIDQVEDPIDRAALDLLFRKVGGGERAIWMTSIGIYGKAHPQAFSAAVDAWQGKVDAAVNKAGYFEFKGVRAQMTTATVSALVLFAAGALSVVGDSFWPLIVLAPAAVVLFVLSNFMTRRTQKGADDFARCQALKRWLTEFSALDERPPTDVKVWGEFMVYAYIFGVAKEVIKQLRDTVPELFEADAAMAGSDYYVPWWFWYADPGWGIRAGAAFSSVLSQAMNNTVATAAAATSVAKGSWSSGGGFGGGFSGGGGGGFGGGGGGAR